MLSRTAALVAIAFAQGCTGTIGDAPWERASRPGQPTQTEATGGFADIGARRLTRSELARTYQDLLGFDVGADILLVPEDSQSPFDNDYEQQQASRALVEGLAAIARHAAARAIEDTEARARIVGCDATASDTRTCFVGFIERFGLRALRRPLEPSEVDALAAVVDTAPSVDAAASIVIEALLQDLELVYRVEIGAPTGDADVRQLTGYEVASRLSYLLWGTMPDDALFALAEGGRLATSSDVRAAAERMLDDPRARAQLERFHAMYLGYAWTPRDPALAPALEAETRALLERVVFEERRPWIDLFTFDETFVDDALAEHYGLAARPGAEPAWVPYGDSPRRGILSHGTFLSVGTKFGDTSPIKRGLHIRNALLCAPVPPPPPGVNVDDPPPADPVTGSLCKRDRLAAHAQGGCVTCHGLLDPIGFGLEAYDETGRFREYEPGLPECPISGDGVIRDWGADGRLVDVATFNGPGELGAVLSRDPDVEACIVRQLYRFTVGRREREPEEPMLTALSRGFGEDGGDLLSLVLNLVGDDRFRYRVTE